MKTKVRRSVAPIYLGGAVWLVFGLFFSLHTTMEYITCALLSVAVFIVAKALFPDTTYQIPETESEKQPQKTQEKKSEPVKPEPALSPEIKNLIKERDRAITEMRRLNDNIPDEKISAQIDHMEQIAAKIIDHVISSPEKMPQIRRFLDYYLPTTLKILNAYDRMGAAGIDGEHITTTRGKVEDMMATISTAFDKQLDALFRDEAMDISTDITVMENMLAQEGLGGQQM